jgi:hypothetical protein
MSHPRKNLLPLELIQLRDSLLEIEARLVTRARHGVVLACLPSRGPGEVRETFCPAASVRSSLGPLPDDPCADVRCSHLRSRGASDVGLE